MAGFSQITLVGYAGRDAELRNTSTGNQMATFSMAYTSRRQNEETTTWFNVVVFGKLAEVAGQYITKGKQVMVVGELNQRTFAKKDGTQGSNLEVTATAIQLLGSREDSAGNGGTTPTPIRRNQPRPQTVGVAGAGEDLDDLPF